MFTNTCNISLDSSFDCGTSEIFGQCISLLGYARPDLYVKWENSYRELVYSSTMWVLGI